MTWTVVERRGDVAPAKRGDPWREVVTFEIMEAGGVHPVASLFACKDGWYEGEQRERARLVAAAPDMEDALRTLVLAYSGPDAYREQTIDEAIDQARTIVARLDAEGVAS